MLPASLDTSPPYIPHGLDQTNSEDVLDTHRNGYTISRVIEFDTSILQSPFVIDTDEHFDCSICLEHDSDEDGGKLKCGHVFHKGCITKWFCSRKNTCPNCRSVLK